MSQKFKYLFKNIGILTISSFASKILIFLLVPLYTSVLSTEEYGCYDLVISALAFIIPITTLNVSDAVMRFSIDKTRDKAEVAKVGFRFICISFVVFAILLGSNMLFRPVQMIAGLEPVILLYAASYLMNSFLTQMAQGHEKVAVMGIAGVVGTIVTVTANILFLLVFKLGLKGFFYANALGCAVPAVYYLIMLDCWSFIFPKEVDRELRAEMLQYSMPLILVSLGWVVNSSLDKFMVAGICGIAANGLLAIAYKIPNILNIIQSVFTQAWQISAVTEYEKEDTRKFYSTTFYYSSAIICICCSCLIILSRPIARLLYSKDFYQAWQYVPFLLISAAFNLAGGFMGPILSAQMNSKAMAKSAIYGIVANVILNTALILLMGIQGAAIATALSSFVIFYVRRKHVGDSIDEELDRKIYTSWAMMIAIAALEVWLQSWIFELVILALIIALFNKETIHLWGKRNRG